MFDSKDKICDLIAAVKRRRQKLYHACQFADFQSYIRLGGIPSRHLLEKRCLLFTPFETDSTDKSKNVWDKVFANLNDFGMTFEKKNKGVPCTYGPIVIVLSPDVFLSASDISVTKDSASADSYDRIKSSFKSIDEFEADFDDSQFLNTQFPKGKRHELSMTISNELASFDLLEKIIVDPYYIRGRKLIEYVRASISSDVIRGLIIERNGDEEWYRLILKLVIEGKVDLKSISTGCSDFDSWAKKVNKNKLDWQFKRYAKYLKAGTIEKIEKELSLPKAS